MKKSFLTIVFILVAMSLSAQTSTEYGDVNMDSIINIVDALMTAQYSVGLAPSPFNVEAADVDGNTDITIVDALFIARFSVGLIDSFPAAMTVELEVLSSNLTRDPDPQVSTSELEELVEGNSQFALDFYQQIGQTAGNFFYSPISLSYALAMTYTGAEENTETQMAGTMDFTLPEPLLHNAYNKLETELTREDEPDPYYGTNMELKIINTTWGQRDFYFEPFFLDNLALNYGAAMHLLDFYANPEGCADIINSWVYDKTGGRIAGLIPPRILAENTKLVLTNAIYYKARWKKSFSPAATAEDIFYNQENTPVMVPMMNQTLRSVYGEGGDYQAIRLGYEGRNKTSMMILMPGPGQLSDFEAGLTTEKLNEINNNMSEYLVTLSMPKFEIEWSEDISSFLVDMGMTDAFDLFEADFSGMTGKRDLMIDKVFHKAGITVDETGTEAAAATAVIVGTSSPSMPEHRDLKLNHPFIFFIYHNSTQSILFIGRVTDPS